MAENAFNFTDLSSGSIPNTVQRRSYSNTNTQSEKYNENRNEIKSFRYPIWAKNFTIALSLVLSIIALILAIVLPLTLRSQTIISTPSTCNDSILNQNETDIDCGGQSCSSCANGKKCRLSTDCTSKNCGPANTCLIPTCSDNIRNQDETDVDCGGKNCTTSKCSFQKMCSINGDCKSKKCSSSKCQACSTQFQTEMIALTVSNSGSLDVTAADLNADGKMDLVAANSNNGTLSILIGIGNGLFKSAVNYNSAAGDLISLSVIDFNNDSYLDIIATSYNGSNVQIFFGTGDSTFITPALMYMMPEGVNVRKVVIGDFNNDLRIDFAVSNTNTTVYEVAVFLGGIGGTIMIPPRYYSRGLSTNSPSMCAVDINQDGHIDLVVANFDTNTLSIFKGDGQGSFQVTPTILALYGNQGPRSVLSADFNLDNIPDLAISFSVSNVMMILLGTGGGLLISAGTFNMSVPNGLPHLIYETDINADGFIDIVTGDNTANNIGIFLNSCT